MEVRVVLIRHNDGPFNVFETERHPFLEGEHRWAEGCMNRSIPLLGICQGPHAPAEQDRLGRSTMRASTTGSWGFWSSSLADGSPPWRSARR
jgi:hypothetical protein